VGRSSTVFAKSRHNRPPVNSNDWVEIPGITSVQICNFRITATLVRIVAITYIIAMAVIAKTWNDGVQGGTRNAAYHREVLQGSRDFPDRYARTKKWKTGLTAAKRRFGSCCCLV